MNRGQHKKRTFEDKFARKYYCNSHRFTGKIKKANNKKFRKEGNKEYEVDFERG